MDSHQNHNLIKLSRLQIAILNAVETYGLDAIAVSCWPRFQSDYGVAVCSLMGQLNTLGLIASCEGDIPSAAGMLALHAITGGDIVTLMDLVTVDPQDDSILLWHCGPTSPELADNRGTGMRSLWLFDQDQKPPTGLANDMVLKPGRATVVGFSADFHQLLTMEGDINNRKPSYRGSRGWLENVKIAGQSARVPDVVQTLMHNGYQHHYPLAYGSLTSAALELAAWLNIQPVEKQNYTNHLIRGEW